MTAQTPLPDHELLHMLRAIGHMGLTQLEPAAAIVQLGHILQPLLPHDFIDLIWINGQGYSRPLWGTAPSSRVVDQWPISETVQKGTPLLIDVATDNAHRESESDTTTRNSQLLIPLRVANETIGVLALGRATPHAFSPAQRDLAEVLADHIALMVQTVSLLHREQQQRERLEALTHIRHAMASSLNVDEVFDTFAAQMAQLVRHEAISVTLLSEDGRSLERFALATATHIAPRAGERQQLDETVAGLAVRSGQLLVRSWPGNGTRIEASFPRGPRVESAPLPTARVLVVDDHALVRQGLVELIKHIEGLTVVGEASDGYTALKAVQQLHPDLVLMDMRLSGIDGAATTKQLLAAHPNLRVIMLTVSDARDDVVRAVEAGARGYLLKEAPVEQLAETIRAVLRGEAVIERRITHHLVERFNHLLRDRPRSDVLSERELEVLRLMVEGRRNREIARLLVLSEHTVKSHVSNIFQKLGVTDRAGAISAAVQRNLLFDRHDA